MGGEWQRSEQRQHPLQAAGAHRADNAWFGVKGNSRTVNVLWVYPNRDQGWFDLLNPQTQALLNPFSDPKTFSSFPHYSTLHTNLKAQEVNLLASYTAWMVANPENAQQFLSMYQ